MFCWLLQINNKNYSIYFPCIRLDLNAAESGVQHNPSQPGRNSLQGVPNEQQGNKDSCSC